MHLLLQGGVRGGVQGGQHGEVGAPSLTLQPQQGRVRQLPGFAHLCIDTGVKAWSRVLSGTHATQRDGWLSGVSRFRARFRTFDESKVTLCTFLHCKRWLACAASQQWKCTWEA